MRKRTRFNEAVGYYRRKHFVSIDQAEGLSQTWALQ